MNGSKNGIYFLTYYKLKVKNAALPNTVEYLYIKKMDLRRQQLVPV
jgi:hypothetical protein